MFSFNAPYGACPECSGIGTKLEVDPALVLFRRVNLTTRWCCPARASNKTYFTRKPTASSAEEIGFSVDTPWGELSKEVRDTIGTPQGLQDQGQVQEPLGP